MDNVNEFLKEMQTLQKCFQPISFELTVRWDSAENGQGGAHYFSALSQEQLNIVIATVITIASNRKIAVSLSYSQSVQQNPYR